LAPKVQQQNGVKLAWRQKLQSEVILLAMPPRPVQTIKILCFFRQNPLPFRQHEQVVVD
jgi:hypothetical protein